MAKATHPGSCHETEIEWGKLVKRLIPTAETVRLHLVGHRSDLDGFAVVAHLHQPAEGVEVRRPLPRLAWRFPRHPSRRSATTTGAPPGVPPEVAALTVLVPPNDLDAVERAP